LLDIMPSPFGLAHKDRRRPGKESHRRRGTRHIAKIARPHYSDDVTNDARDQTGKGVEIRASDADRDRTAAVLADALATGRLTTTEHAERLNDAYAAKTLADLASLTTDLPDMGAGTGAPSVARHTVSARFSKVIRGGRWVAGRHTRLSSRFGALIVNLGDAVLPGREIELELDAFCGKLIVTLPADAQVIDEGSALFAKRSVAGYAPGPANADAPIIRITGDARFSKVIVRRAGDPSYNPWQHWQHWQHQTTQGPAER
jgi:hypothetical protein